MSPSGEHQNSYNQKNLTILNATRQIVRNVIKKFHSHLTIETLPGRGAKKKLNERSLRSLKWKKHNTGRLQSFRLIWINLDWWFQSGP